VKREGKGLGASMMHHSEPERYGGEVYRYFRLAARKRLPSHSELFESCLTGISSTRLETAWAAIESILGSRECTAGLKD
jgi:hypothetical protein